MFDDCDECCMCIKKNICEKREKYERFLDDVDDVIANKYEDLEVFIYCRSFRSGY